MEKYADKLLKGNIVCQSKSAWNAPAILIKEAGFNPEKADQISQWRLCIDCRGINQCINTEFIPLINFNQACHMISKVIEEGQSQNPTNEDNTHIIISFLDLTASYHQTPLTEDSQQYTAFSTRMRHLQFLRLPMRLKVSSSAFVNVLYSVFAKEIANHSMALCVDDALLANVDFSNHLFQLEDIFRNLRAHNLGINPKKVLFQGFYHFPRLRFHCKWRKY